MPSWTDLIEAKREEAQQASLLASSADSVGWDRLADAQRQLVEACDRKVAALERLKQIMGDHDFSTAFDDPEFLEQIKQYLRGQGLWPPK